MSILTIRYFRARGLVRLHHARRWRSLAEFAMVNESKRGWGSGRRLSEAKRKGPL